MTESISSLVGGIASTYDTDRIVILGKGPSVDEIDTSALADVLVIGVNDAERIAPVDITIFHDERLGAAIVANGEQSRLYVTSSSFRPREAAVAYLPHARLETDSIDLMMSRLVDTSDIVIEDVLFLTALEVARLVAASKGRTQTVYMLGFDFDPSLGYAKSLTTAPGASPPESLYFTITMQEQFLRNAMYMLRDSDVQVVHVGRLGFSELNPAEFNNLFRDGQRTRPAAVEAGARDLLVVAEITTNHFGDRSRLRRLITESKQAGADYVKLQKRDVATFYSADQLAAPYTSPFGSTFGDYRNALELDEDDFRFVERLCAEIGIGWFVSILDRPSYEFFRDTGLMPEMIKLPSTISEHSEFLEFVADDFEGSLVLSTGMTDQAHEDWLLDRFARRDRLYLLHANSAYPTPDEHCNVGVVRHYSELALRYPSLVPGYSSHDFGWMASALAVAAGAGMVEKHVKLESTDWAHFDVVAVDLLTPAFREYVQQVRKARLMVGDSIKQVTPSEHHKYRLAP